MLPTFVQADINASTAVLPVVPEGRCKDLNSDTLGVERRLRDTFRYTPGLCSSTQTGTRPLTDDSQSLVEPFINEAEYLETPSMPASRLFERARLALDHASLTSS